MGLVVVLKQERMEVFQEARTLSSGKKPTEQFYDPTREREVKLWEVKELNFSESYDRKVSVVHSQEQWTQTRHFVTPHSSTAILHPCERNRGSRNRVSMPAASIHSRSGTCG